MKKKGKNKSMKITFVFTNGGVAVAKFEDSTYTYIHLYDNMKQLAEDYFSIISDGLDGSELMYWDGNEPEMWEEDWKCCCIYEENTDDENNYTAFTELDPAWGGNVAEFLEALSLIITVKEA